jgi:hypothetical protein
MQVSAVTRAAHLPKDVATSVYARTCIQTRGYEDTNPTLLTPIVAQPTERTQEAPETGDMKLGRRKPTEIQPVQLLSRALEPGHSESAKNLSGGDWPIRWPLSNLLRSQAGAPFNRTTCSLSRGSRKRPRAGGRTKASLSLICRNKCDANHVAKQPRKAVANREVIEKYGRPVRARTAGLHRVNCVV